MSVRDELYESREAARAELHGLLHEEDGTDRPELSEEQEARSNELLQEIRDLDNRINAEEVRAAKLAAAAEKRQPIVHATEPAGSTVVVEKMVYGPDSRNSWWADEIAISLYSPLDQRRQEAEARRWEWSHQIEREMANDTDLGKNARAQFRDREEHRAKGTQHERIVDAETRGRLSIEQKAEHRTGITTGGGATATASSGGAAFVSPYIFPLGKYAPYREFGRALLDQCNHQPMPEYGMDFYVPAVTGGAAVSSQTEAGSVTETDPTFGYKSASLVTLAGQVTLSQQQLDRTGPGFAFDVMVFDQLERDYAPKADVQVINAILSAPTTQTYAGPFAVTTTSGSGGFLGQLKKASATLRTTTGVVMSPTHAFVTETRWDFIEAWADSQGRPLVVPGYAGPFNAAGATSNDIAPVEGFTGAHVGRLPIFADQNIPNLGTTTTDQAIVGNFNEAWVCEGAAVHRILPQTLASNLQVIVQRYSYFAPLIRYPTAFVAISGAGMSAPAYS